MAGREVFLFLGWIRVEMREEPVGGLPQIAKYQILQFGTLHKFSLIQNVVLLFHFIRLPRHARSRRCHARATAYPSKASVLRSLPST